MLTKEALEQTVTEKLTGTGYYLIDVSFQSDTIIIVEIDSQKDIDIDFCVELSNYIKSAFGEEMDKYDLEVGSVGLTTPFKILFQYKKNIGNEVEVLTKDGRKLTGTLTEATEDYFSITMEKKIRREGEKRKTLTTETESFDYQSIKYTKYLIKFK